MNPIHSNQSLRLPSRIFFAGRGFYPALLSILWMLQPAAGWMAGALAQSEITIEGTLKFLNDKAVLQISDGNTFRLAGSNETVSAILGDSRMNGKILRLTGLPQPDGAFEVKDFFVAKTGKLYRVIYHCEVCNITTFSPGDCMCCRAPTRLMEVLPTDPRLQIENPPVPETKKSPQ